MRSDRPDRAAPPHRLRVPGHRPVPAHDGGGEHRHHAAAARLGPRTRIAARVDELIDLVRLDRDEHRDRFPHQLSGGERQRVGVARALAARPRIVLMDEPFGALDPLTRDALGQDYRRLHDELGLTTVMITHDMLEAVLLADRIAVMRDGRVVADGTPAALMTRERTIRSCAS